MLYAIFSGAQHLRFFRGWIYTGCLKKGSLILIDVILTKTRRKGLINMGPKTNIFKDTSYFVIWALCHFIFSRVIFRMSLDLHLVRNRYYKSNDIALFHARNGRYDILLWVSQWKQPGSTSSQHSKVSNTQGILSKIIQQTSPATRKNWIFNTTSNW